MFDIFLYIFDCPLFLLALLLILTNAKHEKDNRLHLFPSFLFGQQLLKLEDCSFNEYEINDHQDSDEDGNVCEAKFIISNSAYYTDNMECALSSIKWTVTVDIENDGTIDIEYSSSLPQGDITLDDTNGNGIPDLYIPMTISNEIQYIKLPDIDGPNSNHKITWAISDDCDLGDLCVTNFSVVDKKAPTPYCLSFAPIPYDGFETFINAEDFNLGSFDNCTDQENIRVSFSGNSIVATREITCDDVINSPLTIRIYFWDDYDNRDYCTVFLGVTPKGLGFSCLQEIEVFSIVKDCKGEPMKGVEVDLDANLVEFPITRITDSEGRYSFGGVPNNIDYTLSASFDDNYLNGVSTLDLVKIVRHLLGLQPFTNPYKIIAADVNGDYHLKVNDVVTLRKLILGIITEIPDSPSWRFIDADFEFEDDLNPFATLLSSNENPFTIEFKDFNPDGYDFIGIKVGDINN